MIQEDKDHGEYEYQLGKKKERVKKLNCFCVDFAF